MIDPELIRSQPHGELLTNLLETEEGGIRSTLEEYGTLQVVGSYALGLISHYTKEPDMDFNLLVPEDTDLVEAATTAGKRLIGSNYPWHKFEVYDNRKAQRPAMPLSVYLGFKAYTPSSKVAADVWFFNQTELYDQANQNHTYVASAISENPELHKVIADIKNALSQSGDYVPSYAIYRAAIELGVSSVDEFKALSPATLTDLNTYKA